MKNRIFLTIVFLLATDAWAQAAPVIVQQAQCSVAAATSCTATLGANVTAGNSVIVLIGWKLATRTVSTVTGGGVTFAVARSNLFNPGSGAAIYYGHNSSGSSASATVTMSGINAQLNVMLVEVSGLSTAAPESTSEAHSSSVTNLTIGAVTPTSADNIIFNCVEWADVAYSSGPTNSFISLAGSPMVTSAANTGGAYLVQTSATAKTTTWVVASATAYEEVMAVFGAPSTGPTQAQKQSGFFNP